jgi:integrase
MLEAARGHRLERAIVLGLVGGLRIAEACGMTWKHVVGDEIYVRGSCYCLAKNGKPCSFTTPADAVVALKRYRLRQAEELLAFGVAQTEETPIVTRWVSRQRCCSSRTHTTSDRAMRRPPSSSGSGWNASGC